MVYNFYTKQDAIAEFKTMLLPKLELTEKGKPDYTKRQKAWNLYTDQLALFRNITEIQHVSWTAPNFVTGKLED